MVARILLALFLCIALISCNKDEERTCTTCTSELTASFEVCREPDGTASVNGENTETDYSTYLEDLQEEGVSCGN